MNKKLILYVKAFSDLGTFMDLIVLIKDAGTYVLSALVLIKVRWHSTQLKKSAFTNGILEKLRSIGTELKEVYSYIMIEPISSSK